MPEWRVFDSVDALVSKLADTLCAEAETAIVARGVFHLVLAGGATPDDGPGLAENYIYASNHRSNADPPVVGSTLAREVHFMAKQSLFRKPMFGRLIRYYNAIPTRRDSFDREFRAGLGYHQPASVYSSAGVMGAGTGDVASKYVGMKSSPSTRTCAP